MSRFSLQLTANPPGFILTVSDVLNVTNELGIASLPFMRPGEKMHTYRDCSLIFPQTIRGEVTHYQCRDAFSRSRDHAH